MTGKTHRRFSICFAYIMIILLYEFNLSEVNYYLSIPIVILIAQWGAKMPDFDHEWQNVGYKTTFSRIINILIHITGGKHRSWQTHSLDIWTWFTLLSYILPIRLYNLGKLSKVNEEIALLVLLSVSTGWLSHLFADMLNGTGIRLVFFSKKTIAFVPKKIFKLRFNTGNEWEQFVYHFIQAINYVLGIIMVCYPFIRYYTKTF